MTKVLSFLVKYEEDITCRDYRKSRMINRLFDIVRRRRKSLCFEYISLRNIEDFIVFN